jgi:glycosyltransferase involved in cell wall biosynthesis
MRIGIAIEETWAFFKEIEEELGKHHTTTLYEFQPVQTPFFSERINRYRLRKHWSSFLNANQVVFFEWASGLLASASHYPKTCGIVTRLHRYEFYQWVDKIEWDAVDRIILVSKAKQREFVRRFPSQADKITVIPEAILPEKFSLYPKKFSGDIGILCHLTPRKRVYETILDFYELNKERKGFHLHIGGGEHVLHQDYYLAMQTLVDRLDLRGSVTFHDKVSDPQSWYPRIDFFISNSYSEGLQVAPMEAMACGCYTLSHFWEGADELLPLENLFFTGSELRKKILEYCDLSEDEKEQKRQAMRAIVCEHFDLNRTKVEIRQIVEDVGRGW